MRQLKKKSKKIILYSVIGVAILMLAVFISFRPFTVVDTNGGGGEVPLMAPTLQSIPSPDTDGDIYLNWNTIMGAVGYQIQMKKHYWGKWFMVGTTGATEFTIEGLTNADYRVAVRAYNIVEEYSIFSNIIWFTVTITEEEGNGGIVEIPEAPVLEMIIPNPNTNGEISLEWNEVSGATKYTIYCTKDEESIDILSENFEQNSYNDLVEESGTYKYEVKAGNSEGYSEDYSNAQEVIVNLPIVPNSPKIGIIEWSFIDETLEISFDWDEVDCNNYTIYKSVDGGDYFLIEENVVLTSYFEVLTERGLYSYKVSAVNINGESELSGSTNINWPTDGGGPEIPIDSDITIIVVIIGLGIGGLVIIYFISKKLKKSLKPLRKR